MSKSIKFETWWNLQSVLNIVTCTVHTAYIEIGILLMLLSVHVTSVLILVQFNSVQASIRVTRSHSSRLLLYALAGHASLDIAIVPLLEDS